MKNYILIIALLSLSYVSIAQKDSVYNSNNQNYIKNISFRIGVGALIPQEGLKEYFGLSPMLDLSVNFPLRNKKSIDITIQLAIPNQKDDFTYLRTIDTIQAKSTLMFNGMLKFKKDIVKTRNSALNLNIGIGASFVTTNARNPFYEGEDNQEKYESITAFLVSPGLEYKKRFRNNDEVTFGVAIQYSPYRIEGAVREDIGGLFYVPKIAYRF